MEYFLGEEAALALWLITRLHHVLSTLSRSPSGTPFLRPGHDLLLTVSRPLLLGSRFFLIDRARELRLLNLLCLVSRLHKARKRRWGERESRLLKKK